jgi:hypothetical protein
VWSLFEREFEGSGGDEGLYKLLAPVLVMAPIGNYGDIARGHTCDGGATEAVLRGPDDANVNVKHENHSTGPTCRHATARNSSMYTYFQTHSS